MKTIHLILALATITAPVFSQSFFVKKDTEKLPLMGANGHYPIVESKGEFETWETGEIISEKDANAKTADVSIDILESKFIRFNEEPLKLSAKLKLVSDKNVQSSCIIIQAKRFNNLLEVELLHTLLELPQLVANQETNLELELPLNPKLKGFTEGKIFALYGGERIELGFPNNENLNTIQITPFDEPAKAILNMMPNAHDFDFSGVAEVPFVKVRFFVDTNNKVSDIEAYEFSHKELIQPAIESIQKSRWRAAHKEGKLIRSQVTKTIKFSDNSEMRKYKVKDAIKL